MSIFKPFRFLPPLEIEAKALAILEEMKQTSNFRLEFPIDAGEVAEFIGLDLVWDEIPDDDMGIVAAMILPLERLIEINERIQDLGLGFIQSTIAHEIGHWILHIDRDEVARCVELLKQGIEIESEPFLCENSKILNGREWQAQYFASCLLMPEYILTEKSRNRNLTKWPDLYLIAEELGVSISNLVHRLRCLGWIEVVNRQIHLPKTALKKSS